MINQLKKYNQHNNNQNHQRRVHSLKRSDLFINKLYYYIILMFILLLYIFVYGNELNSNNFN